MGLPTHLVNTHHYGTVEGNVCIMLLTPRLVAMYLRKLSKSGRLEPNTSLALYSPVHSQAKLIQLYLYLVKGAQNLCAHTYHVHSYAILHSNVLVLPVHVI